MKCKDFPAFIFFLRKITFLSLFQYFKKGIKSKEIFLNSQSYATFFFCDDFDFLLFREIETSTVTLEIGYGFSISNTTQEI